jgi:general secretion pathway protein F
VANLLRDLSTMLSAGQDLDRALHDIEETAEGWRMRRMMSALRNAVRDGCPLSEALAQHPDSFHRLHVGMVKAGEVAGLLARALSDLAELLERQRKIAASVQSALIYPGLLLVVGAGSVSLMLTQVLPQFVPIFEQSGVSLPRSTQMLIDFGRAVSDYGLLALAAMAIAAISASAVLKRPGPRRLKDRLLLRVPLLGPFCRDVIAARFSRVLGTMLVNGVPLITAMDVARDVVGNSAAAEHLMDATSRLKRGGGLAGPLATAGIFPVRAVQLLRVGEANARLGPMALLAADIHEASIVIKTQRAIALLVPVITVAMGIAIAGIVAALMTAMLSLNDLAGAS